MISILKSESSNMHLKILLLSSCLLGITLAQTTNFVNKDSKLGGFAEPQWFKDNIPFVEVPDEQIEEIYYYRFSTLKRHLRYSVPGVGYTVTEFVHKVGYSQKFDTINGAAGHHIYESRWLRDTKYAEDYINFWAREGGAAQQYSEWIADSAYSTFLLSGNTEFIKSQLTGFVNNFYGWSPVFEPMFNLYFLSPHDDAMEHSASSEQTDDPYHGGLGYRPSFNSELYANAIVISKIALMNNDTKTAEEFAATAAIIRKGILDTLWDDERTFFYHMFRENNPSNQLLDSREEIGFFPWRFGVPDDNPKYAKAWDHLFDPQGFDSVYGPPTCEQRSPWYDGNQTSQCCWWNGNSWPYSTGMVINSLAAQLRNYKNSDRVTVDTFVAALHKYAETQYKNGKPFVAECHSPNRKIWVGDSFNHSEHYAHSTYVDNVLGDLLGIEPQADNTFVISPLIPASWPYFIVENLAYHGHNITVLYDSTGTKYNITGMNLYINGRLAASKPQIGRMAVDIPPPVIDESRNRKKVENYAANVEGYGYPMVDASFTSIHCSVWQAVDGRIIYDHIPSNRWTNFESPNEVDWVSIDLGPGRAKTFDEVKLYVYSDVATNEGVVDCPTAVVVEYEAFGKWEKAQNQISTPAVCVPNDVLTIRFDAVQAQKLRVVFSRNEKENWFVGISELELCAPWPQGEDGVYEAEDGYITRANIRAAATASGSSYVGQINEDGASVEITGVWVEQGMEYDVRVYYSNGISIDASMIISVNNVHSQIVTFQPTLTGWGEFGANNYVTIKLPLLRGNNAIIFKHDHNFVELDKIKIMA